MANPIQPSFSDKLGKFVKSDDLVLADVTGATASGTGPTEQAGDNELVLELDVTAFGAGATSLDVDVEESTDGGTTWTVVDSFTQQTAVDTERLTVHDLAPHVRVNYTYAGDGIGAIDFTVQAV